VEDDVAALEAALADGGTAALASAAALYTGDFLEGFALDEEPFEDWRRREAARLRARTLDGLGRLLHRYVEAGDAEAALALGERLLALDPAAEETHRALMRLHIDRGALGAAMRQYERCRAALEAELGVPPSAETEALRRQIRPRPQGPSERADPARPIVAVLPFANLSEDPAQGYFARGFAEDVLRELSRFRSLGVIASQSSFAVDPHLPPAEIGERLGARYLLFGSVRKPAAAAGSVRIGAELVDAETGRYVWTHRYDVAADALFDTQDDIVRGVVAGLALRIDEAELGRVRTRRLGDLGAYDCWLKGLESLRRGTLESHGEARALFQRALEADPRFARAHAGLSLAHFNDWSCHAWDHWDECERLAFHHAAEAVALDDADHVTQFILGRILIYRREFERGEWHLDRAYALNPNDAHILTHMALARAYLGQADRGIEAARTAMRLNPFHDDWYFALAAAPHFVGRRLEEAVSLALRAPDAAVDVRAYLAAALAHLGRTDEARRYLDGFLRLFRTKITAGREPEPDEPGRWLLHVNPFKREEDRAYLLAGLEKAGMPAAGRLLIRS
ncbi:MAG TPA: BTAD domain-containing putative transcriptional regulator, partial [Thermodesulfobacteriota bacterium]